MANVENSIIQIPLSTVGGYARFYYINCVVDIFFALYRDNNLFMTYAPKAFANTVYIFNYSKMQYIFLIIVAL